MYAQIVRMYVQYKFLPVAIALHRERQYCPGAARPGPLTEDTHPLQLIAPKNAYCSASGSMYDCWEMSGSM